MNHVRAFVGHSFTDDDADVVRAFLKYFDQLSQSHPTFTWEHAEPAEPKVLAEKVLNTLSDKNVFIGICTRKERVIAPQRLKKTLLLQGSLRANADQFEWKTSDWIIQEIGVARGRNMDLILLIERGVRQPGGLQGNVEYIPFDRDAPGKAFGKIVEMIAALAPKPSASAGVEAETAPPLSAEERETEARRDDKWSLPQPEWKRWDYEFALIRATALDDTALAERIQAAYLTTEAGSRPENAESWQTCAIYVRLVFGKGASLAELRAATDRWPENSNVLGYLARAYEHYKQHDDAAEIFKTASRKATDVSARLRYLRHAAGAYQAAGKVSLAEQILSSMRAISSQEGTGEREVLRAQQAFAETSSDDELLLATLERIVNLEPDDGDSRFALAYKHAELGNEALALFHYSRIPEQERKDGVWNNLGAAFEQLELPAKSVDAYRKAEEMGSTLAMSNLAHKLMKAGFLSEAKDVCDRALATRDFHKNVGQAVSRLREIPDEEIKKEEETLEKGRPASEFYRAFGRAAARPEPADVSGKWKGPNCPLVLALSGGKLKRIGDYEQSAGFGLTSLFNLGAATDKGANREPTHRFRVEYDARARGQSFVGTVTRKRVDVPLPPSTLLGSATDETKVLMVLSDDGKELDVMEKVKGKQLRRYKMRYIGD